jgi:hypothetical protein
MGVVGFLVLALGLLGITQPWFYGLLLLLGVGGLVLLGRDIVAEPPLIGSKPSLLTTLCGIALGILGVCTFVAALAPPAGLEWDSLSYHLAAPKVYLLKGRIEYLPWDHHSNFPFLLQMLYLLLLGVGSIASAKLCHWLCGMLLVLSVHTFAKRFLVAHHGENIAPVAALITAAVPIFLWEATTAYVDLATALFTWLALYAVLLARSENAESPRLLLSAVLMGLALGTKYTVLGFWGMLLLGIAGAEVFIAKRITPEAVKRVALWAIVALAIGAPWYIKNVLYTGNPVYPFAYELFGGKYWSVENAKQYAEEQARFGLGKTPLDLLLSPWSVTQEAGVVLERVASTPNQRPFIYTEYIIYGFGLSPVLVGLLLLVPFVRGRLSPVAKPCLLFGLGIYLFWFFVMQQTRYLIPALPALSLVAIEVLFALRPAGFRLAGRVAGGFVTASVLWAIFLAGGMAFWGVSGLPGVSYPPVWSVVSGQESRDDYIRKRFPGLGGASLWINANTPKESKVALFEVRGFYLDREYLWAQPDHAEGLLPWNDYTGVDDWLADFKQRGLTTLLLAIPLEQEDGRRWRTLFREAIAQGKLELAYEDRTAKVYRIP